MFPLARIGGFRGRNGNPAPSIPESVALRLYERLGHTARQTDFATGKALGKIHVRDLQSGPPKQVQKILKLDGRQLFIRDVTWIPAYNPLMAYVDGSFIEASPDDKLLRAFVTTGVKVLSAFVNGDWIVRFDHLFEPPAAQKWFQDNWSGFKDAADRVVNSLRDIREDMWEKLRNAGLTSGQLKMKWQLWYDDLLSGRFNNILRRLNSILKSLATVISLAECLAEYKEQVEITLKGLGNENRGDATGLIDILSAE